MSTSSAFDKTLSSSRERRYIVHQLLLACPLLCFLLLLLSIYLLAPEEDISLSKAIVYYCFLVFRSIGEYIFLDLFYFVNLASSCLLIPWKQRWTGEEKEGYVSSLGFTPSQPMRRYQGDKKKDNNNNCSKNNVLFMCYYSE